MDDFESLVKQVNTRHWFVLDLHQYSDLTWSCTLQKLATNRGTLSEFTTLEYGATATLALKAALASGTARDATARSIEPGAPLVRGRKPKAPPRWISAEQETRLLVALTAWQFAMDRAGKRHGAGSTDRTDDMP